MRQFKIIYVGMLAMLVLESYTSSGVFQQSREKLQLVVVGKGVWDRRLLVVRRKRNQPEKVLQYIYLVGHPSENTDRSK